MGESGIYFMSEDTAFPNRHFLYFDRSNRIYALTENNKVSPFRKTLFMWTERESNPRHKDFQSFALPTELSVHITGHQYTIEPRINKEIT